jgi:hypothetical protein
MDILDEYLRLSVAMQAEDERHRAEQVWCAIETKQSGEVPAAALRGAMMKGPCK